MGRYLLGSRPKRRLLGDPHPGGTADSLLAPEWHPFHAIAVTSEMLTKSRK